jgi:acetylornithine deacetylase
MIDPGSTAELLAKLVAFPTVSSTSNLALIDWVETELKGSVSVRRFPNADGSKANILLTVGAEAPGGLVLSGHTDVVPIAGQQWSGDPFTLRRDGGRLLGRGATDMKGFLACAMTVAKSIDPGTLRRPLHLAFSYDEEVGCTGVGSMAEWIGCSGLSPCLAVIGEPSRMRMIDGHKGGLIGWCVVSGKPGHSSQPDRYVNAVMAAGDMIAFINGLRAEMRDGQQAEGFDPPWSTIQVNTITGGLHGNIVAEACRFFWEMRVVPGVDEMAILDRMKAHAAAEIEPAMQAVDPSTGIVFEVQARIPALKPEPSDFTAILSSVLDDPQSLKVPYGTEAGIFQAAGVPAVVCGPGDIAQAHQPDEFIDESELTRCVATLRTLVERELL